MQKKRKTYHHGDLRQAILSETLKLLEERAGPAFTMRELALRLGVSHSAAYRHFKDKEALLAALAVDGFERMAEFQHDALTDRMAPIKRLKRLGTSYIEFARAYPWHFRVMFSLSSSDSGKYPELAEVGARGFQPVVDAVTAGQAAGEIRPGDPIETGVLLWGAVHGLSMLLIDQQLTFAPPVSELKTDRLIEAQVDIFLRGLQKA